MNIPDCLRLAKTGNDSASIYLMKLKEKLKQIPEMLEAVCIDCNQDDRKKCQSCSLQRIKELMMSG